MQTRKEADMKQEGLKVVKGNGSEAPKALQPVRKNAVTPLESKSMRWRAFVPATVTLEDLTNPELWSVVRDQLRAFDIVEVVREDEAFWAEVFVRQAGEGRRKGAVIVKVLRSIKLEAKTEDDHDLPAGFEIREDNQTHSFYGVRVSDGARFGTHSKSWEDARRAIVDHASLR
jgi:hypothetical protein